MLAQPGAAAQQSLAAMCARIGNLTLFLFLMAIAALAHAQQPHYRVEMIAPDPLAKLLRANLDIVRWSTREELTPDQLEQLFHTAPEQIKEILATEGYFSAQVESSLNRDGQQPVARFVIRPGEPARVSQVDLKIVGAIASASDGAQRIEEARRAFGIKVGDRFRQADWNAAKQRVVENVARLRYAKAQIASSRVQVDPQAGSAAIQLQVDSGAPFTFGALQVNGLKRYQAHVVANLNPIRPGEPFDEAQLLKFQRRLLASGYFATALVNVAADKTKDQRVAVLVTVVEAKSQRADFGVGVSTDRGPRGQIGYRDNNFLDRAWRLSANIYVDRLSQSVSGGLQLPRKENGWHYGLDGRFKHEDIQGQETTQWSMTGSHSYTVEEYASSQSLQMLTERSAIEAGPIDNRQALYLSQTWTWNGLDDLINPRSGYVTSLHLGGASEAVLSTRSFGRVLGKVNYLLPLGPRWTLGLRAETGVVIAGSREGIPSAYVFRTGGDTTIRGYAFESLGVREGDAIVGGRYLALGSIELTRWITSQWGAAVFYDIGNAFDDLHEFDPVSGYGAGVRWRSPVGNLSFDGAYGEAVGDFRVHFSIGYAFR